MIGPLVIQGCYNVLDHSILGIDSLVSGHVLISALACIHHIAIDCILESVMSTYKLYS